MRKRKRRSLDRRFILRGQFQISHSENQIPHRRKLPGGAPYRTVHFAKSYFISWQLKNNSLKLK